MSAGTLTRGDGSPAPRFTLPVLESALTVTVRQTTRLYQLSYFKGQLQGMSFSIRHML